MESKEVNPSPKMKFVRGATRLPLIEVDDLTQHGTDRWRQVDFLNPEDTNLVTVAGLAEHPTKKTFEFHFWYHEMVLVLDGEMIVQHLDTNAVYRGHRGDLFYWGPGLRIRLGGVFRAYFVKTPIPIRWTRVSENKIGVDLLHLNNEITHPGSLPDELRLVRKIASMSSTKPQMKFIKSALSTTPVKVTDIDQSGVVQDPSSIAGALVNPVETNLTIDAIYAEHDSKEPIECDHSWHQMVLILDGEMITENLYTGALYRGHEGDFVYWGPGLKHSVGGEFRVFAVSTPPPRRWIQTSKGNKKLYMAKLQDEIFYPGSPPDEVRKEPL